MKDGFIDGTTKNQRSKKAVVKGKYFEKSFCRVSPYTGRRNLSESCAIYLWGEIINLWFSIMLVTQCCVAVENIFFLWDCLCFFSLPLFLFLFLKELQTHSDLLNSLIDLFSFYFVLSVQLLQLHEWCIFFFLFCPSHFFSLLLHTQTVGGSPYTSLLKVSS